MKDISVVIPHFNSWESLERLMNTLPLSRNIEVLIIDDKSNLDPYKYEVLKSKYNYENVHFYKNMTNIKGAGVCRNIGIKHSKGRWFLFADSDDFFVQDFYEKLLPYLKSKSDIIFFNPTSLDEQTKEISDRHIEYSKLVKNYINNYNEKNEALLRYQFFVPWSKLIKQNLVKENSISFEEVIASNDIMFSTAVGYKAKSIVASLDTIYSVTKSKGSLTTKINEEIFDVRLEVLINYYKYLKNNLSADTLKYLNIKKNFRAIIIQSIKYRLGWKKVIQIVILLKKNHISIVERKLLNPLNWIRAIKKNYNNYRNENKYYSDSN